MTDSVGLAEADVVVGRTGARRRRIRRLSGRRRRRQHRVDHVDVGAAGGVGARDPVVVDLDVAALAADDHRTTVLRGHLALHIIGPEVAQHHVVEERRQQHRGIGLQGLHRGRVELGEGCVGGREDHVRAAVEDADDVHVRVELAGDGRTEGAQIGVVGDGLRSGLQCHRLDRAGAGRHLLAVGVTAGALRVGHLGRRRHRDRGGRSRGIDRGRRRFGVGLHGGRNRHGDGCDGGDEAEVFSTSGHETRNRSRGPFRYPKPRVRTIASHAAVPCSSPCAAVRPNCTRNPGSPPTPP